MMTTPRRYRCRYCDVTLPAWYAVPGEPNGAMLLQHMSQSHPVELRPYLAQMASGDDITAVIVQAYDVVEECSPNADRAYGSEYEWNRKPGWVLLRIQLVRIAQRTQLTSSHGL
jgi:hypothetical protein